MATQLISISNLFTLGIVFIIINITRLIITRLILHPLSHIPGPKIAALTSWYEIYYNMVLPGQYVFHIQKLHKQYGPIIRVNPDEVHVNDLQYLDYIYAGTNTNRDKPGGGNLELADSLAGTADFHLHRQRRKAMGTFFSKQAIFSLESSIQAKIDKMCEYISQHAANSTIVNLSDLFYGLAWDVVFEYCFGIASDLVTDETGCARVRHNLQTLLQGVYVNRYFPWMKSLSSLPVIGAGFTPAGLTEMMRINRSVAANVASVLSTPTPTPTPTPSDTTLPRSIFYSIRDNAELPASEKSLQRLRREGAFLVLAGTESTAASMKITMFHVLSRPAVLASVRAELDSLPASPSLTDVEALPYLAACIAEGNRLSFGITVRNTRLSHDEMVFGDVRLPPRCKVSTTSLAVSANPDVFPEPWRFVPERWLGDQGVVSRKFEFAFGRGARRCIGVNLAMAELGLAIATCLRRFEFELYKTDESDVRFLHDYQVAHPRLDSKGVRAVVRRRKV